MPRSLRWLKPRRAGAEYSGFDLWRGRSSGVAGRRQDGQSASGRRREERAEALASSAWPLRGFKSCDPYGKPLMIAAKTPIATTSMPPTLMVSLCSKRAKSFLVATCFWKASASALAYPRLVPVSIWQFPARNGQALKCRKVWRPWPLYRITRRISPRSAS